MTPLSPLTRLGSARPGLLVAVDFDGTLAPIVDDPASSRLVAGALDRLIALAEAGTTVAVVTGRPAALVVELGELRQVPGIVVLGSYGAQRWTPAGVESLVARAPGLDAAREELAALATDGVVLEDKDLAVALHTRPAPHPVAAYEHLLGPVREIATRHGLVLEPGSLVLELRTPGPDKGDALRTLLPGHDAVLFAGDDEGDVLAQQAIRAWDGPSVCVCVERADGSLRLRQGADLVVSSPAGLVELLDQLVR